MDRSQPDGFIQVIVGQLRTTHAASQILHQNTHLLEQLALGTLDHVAITIVPLHLEKLNNARAATLARENEIELNENETESQPQSQNQPPSVEETEQVH